MIAVAIIAILASIAFPSYTRYVQQTRRAAVMANMGEMAQWLERWYSKNNQYPSTDNANEAAALSSAAVSPSSLILSMLDFPSWCRVKKDWELNMWGHAPESMIIWTLGTAVEEQAHNGRQVTDLQKIL